MPLPLAQREEDRVAEGEREAETVALLLPPPALLAVLRTLALRVRVTLPVRLRVTLAVPLRVLQEVAVLQRLTEGEPLKDAEPVLLTVSVELLLA